MSEWTLHHSAGAWLVSVASPGPGASRLGGAGGKIAEITRPGPRTKVRAVTSGVWHHPGHWELALFCKI